MSALHVADDTRGQNYWQVDKGLRELLPLRLDKAALDHLEPHLDRLGELAGGHLDELADAADKNPPVLHPRDRYGRDEEWIEYHPAYKEMEKIAFGDLGMHAMSHRAGVLGLDRPANAVEKYAIQYLFAQAEFGILCPVNVTDTAIYLIIKYGSQALQDRLLPRMLSTDTDTFWRGAQFLTETTGGSDVGALESIAEPLDVDEDGVERWKVSGQKWFCSHADADASILIARRKDGGPGSKGLALFVLPRTLEDGTRNAYRIVRLKDKLGTKSMASGEIVLDGAVAYLLGDADNGIKQALAQVNLSRLSNGVRAAGRMRRSWNEAMAVADSREAFGNPILQYPMLRRQLMKILLPTEQSLSMIMFTAAAMDHGEEDLLRILTPLMKLRACRDGFAVASASMEVRGGNGYIEEWANARILRDAQLGTIWEGTANINALDVITRAAAKDNAHHSLADKLYIELKHPNIPSDFREKLSSILTRAVDSIDRCIGDPELEEHYRTVSGLFYHVVSAVLLATEGAEIADRTGDARRLLLARQVVKHRIETADPFAAQNDPADIKITDILIAGDPVTLEKATELISA